VRERFPLDRWRSWFKGRAFAEVPALIILVFFVRGIFLYFGEYWTTKVGASVIKDLRHDLFDKVVFKSLRFFQMHSSGEIVARVLSDIQRVQRVSTHVLADLVRVGTMVPFFIVLALIHDWKFTVISLVAVPLLGYPMVRFGRRLRRASTLSQEAMAEVASVLNEAVNGVKVVQAFSMQGFEIGRFVVALKRMLRADLKAGRAVAAASPVMEILGAIAGALLFYYAGKSIAAGKLDPGDFTVVLGSLGFLFASIRKLNRLNAEIQQAVAAATRMFAMMDYPREIEDLPEAVPLEPFDREIQFENVGFGYDDKKILDSFDLTIKRGEIVALVGGSGAGKTTIANLLLRFFDTNSGRVLIDGVDIRGVSLKSLRDQVGLVTQETVLFDDTVRHNIAYGSHEIPQGQVEQAARAAHAHDFISELDKGYDTIVGEHGARLSMGQRQRVAIARALLKNPPILVLDEATSALDAESEAIVQKALEALLQGRTALVIAHRLATVRHAHRIVVLEQGRIAEEGSHDELLAAGGTYAHLCKLQFGV
jgi:subfamily B ATP-binding cassette protein MsbA